MPRQGGIQVLTHLANGVEGYFAIEVVRVHPLFR